MRGQNSKDRQKAKFPTPRLAGLARSTRFLDAEAGGKREWYAVSMGVFRMLLALSVFVAHSKPLFHLPLVGGVMAVQAFYMLSGFYISMVLHERYVGEASTVRFYRNRIIRLYPAYLFTLLVGVVATAVFHVGPFDTWIEHASEFHPVSLLILAGSNLSRSKLGACQMQAVRS